MQKKAAIVDIKQLASEWAQVSLFDIAANLSDERFKGEYYGKKCHEPDFDRVIKRANMFGVKKFLLAAGYIEDARTSYEMSLKSEHFYSTIGVHPCRATEPYKKLDCTPEQRSQALDSYFQEIQHFIEESRPGKIVAIGECGLDYDRLEYADKEAQLMAFAPHFDLASKYKLPMYLHSRATGMEFADIVRANRHKFSSGVVHSFTGDQAELEALCEMGLFIGINGCSMKTAENMEIVKLVPMERLMVETDCPYCDIRNSHHSAQHVRTFFPRKDKSKYNPDSEEIAIVKDRNEPCTIVQVVEVIAALKGVTKEEISRVSYENTLHMFGLV